MNRKNSIYSMLQYLKRNLGTARLVVYIITIVVLFFAPVITGFVILKLLIIFLLLLLFYNLYTKFNFYNINYQIPDTFCIICLVKQFGDIIWGLIYN